MIVGNTCIKEEEVSSGAASDEHDRDEEIDVVSRSISPVPGIVNCSQVTGMKLKQTKEDKMHALI